MRKLAIVFGLLLVSLLAVGCGSSGKSGGSADVIKIGMVGPLTGPAAEAGIALKQGAQLAVDEWNEKGGIAVDGKKTKVEILFEDSQSKPEAGVSVAEKLITRDKVNVLIGDAFASSVTMAVMELAPKYGIPVMSIEPVSGEIAKKVKSDPEKYATYWKGDFNSDAYGQTVFETYQYLVEKGLFTPKTKTVAFVVEDTDYGRSNAEVVKNLFAGIGWNSVALETVPLGYTDFYPQLNKIKNLNPDVLVSCFTSLSSGVALVKQFQEIGLTASHMAIYYPLRPEFTEQAGSAAEGLLWTPLIFDPENLDQQKAMADQIKSKYDAVPNYDHAAGYDGINNMLSAIEAAGSLEPKAIVAALSETDRKGVQGRFVFDQESHTIKAGEEFVPVPTAQIEGGKNCIIWPENVASHEYTKQSWVK
ncbi:branched-chain amino acid transport system substrate-binding protein [Desulfotomaculum arcticum]|uniref:Branched-chain amino acid transport system substrate-binding protein n=1 Tax=Desulfotruncus arcticus DSM 17038 TaxID=1121424 RepID=A0A1I2PL29_9FIRM|nr:ABC transporter substrate-binding protein [Desulfotruncus arcticus]SFG14346.1 branched-chain amino acid transport system substrate-binding protein [Desulfotomaculum arcticum] [Desulfotruncus arcticus DSM 17038]